ncbi:MAG: putative N-acylneuraminate cytidylyltransferase [candidate division NC10 bacterium]|nr:putative N-acylneuraminate cytidylyltransferase [candidate division NC10 bacterium]MBM2842168.1 putative N-acylneuraminate cytidylyltransferase [Anaerolineales bacterium]
MSAVPRSRPDSVLALIPARGGSKSFPHKNLRLLGGHPLIAYSIAAGLSARSVGRVVVSTDDEEIAEVARAYGADVPFLRPAPLALDETPDLPVVEHALAWLAKGGYRPEIVVQLRPTSPLRPRDLVDRGIAVLIDHPDADSARAVVPSGQNPYKMWRRAEDGRIVPLLEDGLHEPYNMPRQLLPPTYWQTGHLDVIRTGTVLRMHSLTGDRVFPIMVDPDCAVDIDTAPDLARAEALLREGRLDLVIPAAPSARSVLADRSTTGAEPGDG